MPRASRMKVARKVHVELQDNFAFLISSLRAKKDIQQFFHTFLTDEEKIMLTKRLMLYILLENNHEPRKIAAVLGISRETVYQHKAIWLHADEMYIRIIRKIASRVKTKQFWQMIEAHLRPLELFLEAKSNIKSRAEISSVKLPGEYE